MRNKMNSTKSLLAESEEISAMLTLAESEIQRLKDSMETMKQEITSIILSITILILICF